MTDHRVTDLLYGHLGEASYDVDEQRWCFSSQTGLGKLFLVKYINQGLQFAQNHAYSLCSPSKSIYLHLYEFLHTRPGPLQISVSHKKDGFERPYLKPALRRLLSHL